MSAIACFGYTDCKLLITSVNFRVSSIILGAGRGGGVEAYFLVSISCPLIHKGV
jgi:hypothetical protein